jgi:CYTH domain-containing protein
MTTEIERKFLVDTEVLRHVVDTQAVIGEKICQGYLTRDPDRAVRIRIKGEFGYLTIKGASSSDGTSRFEWDHEIPLHDAEDLIQLCLPAAILKTRYEIQHDGHRWEVDVFEGENQGLTLAEIELQTAEEAFSLPAWVTEEVTGIDRYYNAQLSLTPFRDWSP